VFNDQTSMEQLKHYLDSTKPYDEIYATLLSNVMDSIGLASIEQWQSVLSRARSQGRFIGVDEQKYPRDIASSVRHHTELKKLDGRYPIPEPLKLNQLDEFLAQAGDRYSVRWIEHPVASPISG
jgi:hypothetical protein